MFYCIAYAVTIYFKNNFKKTGFRCFIFPYMCYIIDVRKITTPH